MPFDDGDDDNDDDDDTDDDQVSYHKAHIGKANADAKQDIRYRIPPSSIPNSHTHGNQINVHLPLNCSDYYYAMRINSGCICALRVLRLLFAWTTSKCAEMGMWLDYTTILSSYVHLANERSALRRM